jgi:RNA polymerase sigma-70 factor (ECF subfamily)
MIALLRRYQSASDEELMRRICSHNTQAFNELYRRYSHPILHYFLRMLGGDEQLAQDFLQELFLKVVDHPHYFDTKQKFETWIFSIAHNMCKNEYRRQEIRSRPHFEYTLETETGNIIENDMDFGTFQSALEQALYLLPSEQRSAFILKYQNQLSIREIQSILGCSEGTVKSRIYHAARKLACHLREFNPQE